MNERDRKYTATPRQGTYESRPEFVARSRAFEAVVEHAQTFIPSMQDILRMPAGQGGSIYLASLSYRGLNILMPIGGVTKDGRAFTTLSELPLNPKGNY